MGNAPRGVHQVGLWNPRAHAARTVVDVVVRGRYIDTALAHVFTIAPADAARDKALVQELVYGCLRWYHQLAGLARHWLRKPLRARDADVHALLLIGLYQLRELNIPAHVVVKETVAAAEALGKDWAKQLINACLRGYLREPHRADTVHDAELRWSHPRWLLKELERDYPDHWQTIVHANNARPPMALRVNLAQSSRADYLTELNAAALTATPSPWCESALVLDQPCRVESLPGFAQGRVSVQDTAAQFAAPLLDPQPGDRVLDACAAPGGKTVHLLEHARGRAQVLALDHDAARVVRIRENLVRAGLTADVVIGDATRPRDWWDGCAFARILLDAPCSASGVIRRHPDIKLRRRPEDLARLTATQSMLLDRLWPLLEPGGKLLYVTCSVLACENVEQIEAFLARTPQAGVWPIILPVGRACRVGWQVLPGEENMDGFYYAGVTKY
ncbi:MAG: 16S rRNA (cytosine(967)-C(5))-methyltransferase RsmB [Pseudomonadota bacterium]|nr:MAG: 16S rRNA (cytosine(967)-C(5))-methyltransferase RsmB [Pseudomonadota bacterium]